MTATHGHGDPPVPPPMRRRGIGGAALRPLPASTHVSGSGFPPRDMTRVNVTDRSGQTGAVRYRYTGPVWPETGPNRLNSNLNSKAAVQPVRNGLPVGLTGVPTGLAGLPVGLTGNRPNSNFFLFLFKFKCPQSILNKYLYNIF